MALRVDDRYGIRQLGPRLVVVGDDQVDAEFPRAHGRFVAPDTTVHRHDDRGALGVQPIDGGGLQTVAVLQSVGDEVADVAAQHLHRATEDDRRGDAIDVVVAMHDDSLAGGKRPLEADHGRLETGQRHGVVQVVEGWSKEPAGQVRISQAALYQQLRDDRLQAQRARQPFGRGEVGDGCLPDRRDHSPTAAASVKASPRRPIWRNF